MRIFEPEYFKEFQKTILSHNIRSGEVILLIYYHDQNRYDFETLIKLLFLKADIKTEEEDYKVTKLKRNEAIESIRFGLSTKVNYTCIDREFSDSDKKRYSNGFIDFFTNPDYYTIDTRIFKEDLDLNDFWENGGAIVIDNKKIGIFWINDLYDKFN